MFRIFKAGFRKLINTYKTYKDIHKKKKRKGKKCIVVGTPSHGNLGDQAIAMAEIQFLQRHFPSMPVIEITEEFYDRIYKKDLSGIIQDGDIVLLHGGGNMGILYLRQEEIRRNIIKSFPNNWIIMMPQTIDFGSSKEGLDELNKSKAIYNAHQKLWLFAREQRSFAFMQKEFNASVFLVPDIVLTMEVHPPKSQTKSAYGLTCFRTDVEKHTNDEFITYVHEKIKETYGNCIITDTVVDETMYIQTRERYVNEKFQQFENAEVAVTDRLHGMIFSLLCNTPCISMKNSNFKVEEMYHTWVKQFGMTSFVSNKEEFNDAFETIKRDRPTQNNRVEVMNKEFAFFIDEVNAYIRKGSYAK